MTSQQIRQQFLDFFASKGHAFVPSSPVVPHDDPTLMFTNAGMNQFKPIFLGAARPDHPRVANSQKCIRAGGKHNDLDDVGQDTYHHTFFEMLGNWSFGDYFKKEAIEWAWELLTKVWGIDRSCLHATYFGGQRKGTEARRHEGTEGQQEVQSSKIEVRNSDFELRTWELEPDYEARDLWLSVTDIDPSHVHPGSMKDNFWEMGETGPCGPCSEIHIDLTPDKSGRELVNEGDARVIELWNLVFIQFNRAGDGKLTPLPAKHVDTGMGFERLCAVLQGMQDERVGHFSNYETDVFSPLFEAIQKRTGALAYGGTLPVPATDEGTQGRRDEATPPLHKGGPGEVESTILRDVSYRVIADHLRCLVFALTDGAIPSNEGRGYVLRRILRRAVRYGRQYFNMHEPFLCDLVPTVVEHMARIFPELRGAHGEKNVQHVTGLIRDEEGSFLRTLEQGLKYYWQFVGRALWDRIIEENETRSDDDIVVFTPVRAEQIGIPEPAIEVLHPETTISIRQHSMTIERFTLRELTASRVRRFCVTPPVLPGFAVFKLHDTYGFPIDLTVLMAAEIGVSVDVTEYERLMEDARERSRGGVEGLWEGLFSDGLSDYTTRFDGYAKTTVEGAIVQGILRSGSHFELQAGEEASLVLNETPFYPEQGGQVGDVGVIRGVNAKWEFHVADTKRAGGAILHFGRCKVGPIPRFPKPLLGSEGVIHYFDEDLRKREKAEAVAIVDFGRHRFPTMQNHTSTHILNWALRDVLGEHVQQKGSLVDPEKTRFDFSHNKQLSENELAKIEQYAQSQISNALPVVTNPEVDQKKAREINTLRAVFGEKYPNKVRVVSIGADIDAMLRDPTNPKWMQYSVEFCGGTHLKNSKEAEEFVLVHEEAVAKGVRRLVGLTGEKAKEARQRGEFFLEVSGKLRTEVQSSKFKKALIRTADPTI